MKIIFIGPSGPPWGGMAVQTRSFLFQCDQNNQPYEYIPLVPPMAVGKQLQKFFLKLKLLFKFYFRCLITFLSANIVHLIINSGKTWILHAPFVCVVSKCFGKKLLINYRGGDAKNFIQRYPYWTLPFLKMADYLVVQSAYLQAVFSTYHLESEVIPNPVDRCFFGEVKALPRKNQYHLLIARHLEPVYNIDSAIKAMSILKKQETSKFYLSILGDGTQKQRLQALIEELQLDEIVQLVGEVDHKDILLHYAQADIVINTSLQDNFPNALLEASACGIPVITTSVGGIAQLYQHKKTAWLIEPNQEYQIVEAIKTVVSSPDLYQELSKNGLALVENWTWDKIFPLWQSIYDQKD